MLYLVAEDNYYYEKKQIEELKKIYQKDEILIFPEIDEVKKNLSKKTSVCVLSPIEPHQLDKRLKGNSLFEIVHLKNYAYPFTKDQIDLKMDKNTILSNKLGIQISTSNVTFKDYGGSTQKLIDEARKIEYRFLLNLSPKGFFTVGIPGTGKSFFAKCYAGETGRKLVEFNISKIKEAPNPMERIQMILAYFKNTPGKYLLWMDEIEKQFADESTTDLLGVFLTELNEFQTGKSNVFFIATANNIEYLSNKYPELLRPGGRFDKLIYLLPPKEEDTDSVFKIHIKTKTDHFKKEMLMSILLHTMFNKKDPKYIMQANIVQDTRIDSIAHYIYEKSKDKDVFKKIKEQIYPMVKLFNNKTDNLFENGIEYIKKDQITEIQEQLKAEVISTDEIYPRMLLMLNNLIELASKGPNGGYAITSLLKDVIEKHGFHIDIKETIATINNEYREKTQEKSRFPYTPSEIKNFVEVVYIEYYLSSMTKEKDIHAIIHDILTDLIPIQVQFEEGIKRMASQAENFMKI